MEDGGGFNFEVAQTSKAAEKLLVCTIYIRAYLIFVIRYFCRINPRFNKDVILNTELLLCLVWSYLLLFMRKKTVVQTKNGLAVPKPRRTWVLD